MRHPLTILASFGLLSAAPAFAQLGGQPQISVNTLVEQVSRLNIQDIQEDTPIQLIWSASLTPGVTYEYEMSYDETRTINNTTTFKLLNLDPLPNAPEAKDTVEFGKEYRVSIRPEQIVNGKPGDDQKLPGGNATVDKWMRTIYVRVYQRSTSSTPDSATDGVASWLFIIDTKRPPAPVIGVPQEGENRVRVHWTKPASEADVATYEVFYCPTITSSMANTSTTTLPCAEPLSVKAITRGQENVDIEEGLQNDVEAAFAVRAVDELGNTGPFSAIVRSTPREVSDFFEFYKDQQGDEEGGFCFIATAATGSYAHPTVQVLRAFRDFVLKRTPLGTLGVWAYYHTAPPIAGVVASSPELKSSVRLALIPVALLAFLITVAPLFGLGVIVWRAGRNARVVASFLALAVLALPAQAYESSRPKSKFSLLGLGVQFKGGPYLPAIADEVLPGQSGDQGAFRYVFAEERNPDGTPSATADENALYAVGLDLQLFRGFGTAGIGGTFGFMQFVGRASFPQSGQVSNDTTVFNLMPLTLTAFYRFDWLADRSGIPLVPYVRGGLAYDVWWITNGRGQISRWRGADKESSADDKLGRGGKLGLSGTLGMSVLLNVIEPRSARSLFESTGIRGTYVFIEYQIDRVDGFGGGGFDLSDSTWNLGVYLEL